jgi:WD40 repeat protein
LLKDDYSNGNLAPIRFVTGGCDNNLNIWTINNKYNEDLSKGKITNEKLEKGHTDWVRDVSWLNFPGYTYDIIASAGEDENVLLWTKNKDNTWESKLLSKFNTPVWRVNWSQCGSYLAVSAGDNCTYLYKVN